MDAFINGERHDKSKKRAAEEFIKISGSSMEDLKIRALIKDCLTNDLIKTKSDGFIVDKYSGDEVMALFGAKVESEVDTDRAIRAGIQMQ